jgi:outer membrane protein assembly factor BamB
MHPPTPRPERRARWPWLLAAASGCVDPTGNARAGQGSAGSNACGDLVLVDPAPPVAGIQAQYRLDPRHQGLAPPETQLESVPEVVWKRGPLGVGRYNASKSSPAVDRDLVYVGEDDGRLYALERATGTPRWTFATRQHFEELGRGDGLNTGIHGSPAFDDHRVYIGDYAGWLYAVDRSSGVLVWEQKLGGSIGSSPVLFGQVVWIAVEFPAPDGKVFALCAASGTPIYESSFLGFHPHGTVSLAPSQGRLVVGTGDGSCFGIDLGDGRAIWERRVGGAIKSTAAVTETTAYVTAWDGRLHAFDLETGEPHFVVPTGGPSMSSPAVYSERVCFGSHDTKVRCVDGSTGEVAWEAPTGGIVSSSPTVVPEAGLVLVGATDGQLYAFYLEDGTLAWQKPLDGPMTSVPVAVDRSVFVNDDTGTVWRFDSS